MEEHYKVSVLARDQFVACIFLAGVDRNRCKDAIDKMNNDFLHHGKEYPSDVSSMVTWLLKRRGNASNKKEDDTTDGILTSFCATTAVTKMLNTINTVSNQLTISIHRDLTHAVCCKVHSPVNIIICLILFTLASEKD